MRTQPQPWQEAAAEIWKLLRETQTQFKESQAEFDQRFKESQAEFDQRFKESQAEFDQRFKESQAEFDQRFKEINTGFEETKTQFKEINIGFEETKTQFRESQDEADRRSKKVEASFERTNAEIEKTMAALRRAEGLFTSQWGRMLEALVEPSALQLFQDRNIEVRYIYPRMKSQVNGQTMELDLLLENGDEIVVLEVKSILKVNVVTEFLEDMAEFFDYFPKYRGYKVYAGVAGLTIDENADRYAYRQGLFVLKVGREGMIQLLNNDHFQPKNFGRGEY